MAGPGPTEPEDALLCAKFAINALQSQLAALRARRDAAAGATPAVVSRTLALYHGQLGKLHAATRAFLLALAEDEAAQAQEAQEAGSGSGPADAAGAAASAALMQQLAAAADEVPGLDALETEEPAALAARVRQQRAARLEGDVAAMRLALAALPRGPHDPSVDGAGDALAAVMRLLAAREQSLRFHVRLAAEVAQRFGTPGSEAGRGKQAGAAAAAAQGAPDQDGMARPSYSADNFAYGSTPYTSWLQALEAAGDAAKAAMAPPGREYVVWGSSCGWLVLYGAATYGWRSRGVDLLACLHDCATAAAAEAQAAGVAAGAVRLACGDLLDDDVRAAGVVLLADQCWDEQLAAAAAAKLARELQPGALCVTYSGAAVAAVGKGGAQRPGEETSGAFEEVATVRAPVSWARAQVLRVFRRRHG